jgi:hypothetical protein
MRSFSIVAVLLIVMIVGDKGYGCDWLRPKQVYYPGVVYVANPVPAPVVVVQPQPQPVPVVVYQQVLVPVVEPRVYWVWPNYYPTQQVMVYRY